MNGLVSIHDLMPETMDRVEAILDWLEQRSVPPATLLVVPGKPWTSNGLSRLRELAEAGHELAAHGWQHRTQPRRFWHRLHATFVSHNVAEHLNLDSAEITELMLRSFAWFPENGLPSPRLYVPPAWALGNISAKHLAQLPYHNIETTFGILQRNQEGIYQMQRLPLSGYEADTDIRAAFLRKWNTCQARSAKMTNRPLRISIHPDDPGLPLRNQMQAQILMIDKFVSYESLNT
ncbi:MAG: DUF2334 domain-containing protein [Verrucomicrobia bacterium]|jgi:predicted deacetylase|nr:DUF2334 domain-containing protein [Verrucomicrobiota bacterium]